MDHLPRHGGRIMSLEALQDPGIKMMLDIMESNSRASQRLDDDLNFSEHENARRVARTYLSLVDMLWALAEKSDSFALRQAAQWGEREAWQALNLIEHFDKLDEIRQQRPVDREPAGGTSTPNL
jgi:hypothetical protein